ncbi:DNA primase, partial [bacterium]
MPGRIPDNVIDDILSRVDIVEIISGYIPLKKAGRNFRANCPFHNEKTPSFMVSPDKQIYHCFGCGAGGNVFNFLMQYERLEFSEAVSLLAKKTGVVLPQFNRHDPESSDTSTQLFKINELAADFYANNLNASSAQDAKNYLLKRGLKPEIISSLKLGFANDSWDSLIVYLRSKNLKLSTLEKAGLVLSKTGGGFYDRFRKRIIFPVFDIKSRVIAFGARVLDNTLPKYVNSPETPIYVKGRNLYGLHLAKDAMRREDFAVIVEGFLDFIIPYQEGLQNIVASQGTALTLEQIRLIKRYTHNVVVVYDSDIAGQLATLRSLDMFIDEGMGVRVVFLPQSFDPDTFVRKFGILEFKTKIAQAQDLFEYKISILKSKYSIKESKGKELIASEMLSTIDRVTDHVLRGAYIRKLSEELCVGEQYVYDKLNKMKSDKHRGIPIAETVHAKLNINSTEGLLLKLMLEEKENIRKVKDKLEPADFQDDRISKIVGTIFNFIDQGKEIEPNFLINYFGDDSLSRAICETSFS